MDPIIGLEGLVAAKLTADSASALSYGAVEPVMYAVDVQIEDKSADSEPKYADNKEAFRLYKNAKIGLTIELLAAAQATLAQFYGHTVTSNELIKKDTDTRDYWAIGFRADDGGGKQDGIWLRKCYPVKRTNSMSYHTREGETVTVQTVKLEFECISPIFDRTYMMITNSGEPEMADTGFDDWFDAPPQVEGEE